MIALFALACIAGHSGPRLDVRASPPVAIAPVIVTVYAEIKNASDEWLCPEVKWIALDGTVDEVSATQLSDCDDATEPEAFWMRRYQVMNECHCVFTVELRHGTRLLAKKSAIVEVH